MIEKWGALCIRTLWGRRAWTLFGSMSCATAVISMQTKHKDAKSQGFGCFYDHLVAKAAMGDSSGVELVAATLTHIFTAATGLVLQQTVGRILFGLLALPVSSRTSQ